MEPIRRLTKKDVEWEWSDEQDMAFNKVKKLVTEAPILSYYDPTHELQTREAWEQPCYKEADPLHTPVVL